jgi:hypothetical protein
MYEHLTMEEQLLALMKNRGVPITRENYLHLALFREIPDPGVTLLPSWRLLSRT